MSFALGCRSFVASINCSSWFSDFAPVSLNFSGDSGIAYSQNLGDVFLFMAVVKQGIDSVSILLTLMPIFFLFHRQLFYLEKVALQNGMLVVQFIMF